MQSKTNLFIALDEIKNTGFKFIDEGLNHPMIGNETYGRRSMIYINNESPEVRAEVELKLRARGFAPSRSYDRNGSVSEIQVNYFKGFHWDE